MKECLSGGCRVAASPTLSKPFVMEPLWRGLTTLGRSTDAAAQSAVDPSSGGSKNVWRVILRARGSLELKIEWRPGYGKLPGAAHDPDHAVGIM